jgi:hypothetical protein
MLINGMGSAARAASASPLVHLKCIDMDVQQLKAFVSVFTDASRVKLSRPLNDKLTKLALGGALEIRWAKDTEEDALRCAVITAVACTLMHESDIPKNAVLQGA